LFSITVAAPIDRGYRRGHVPDEVASVTRVSVKTAFGDSSREPVVCAALAAASSSLALYGPVSGGDLAAHLWRTNLVQHGFVVWGNL
jgi:hypothetical protein